MHMARGRDTPNPFVRPRTDRTDIACIHTRVRADTNGPGLARIRAGVNTRKMRTIAARVPVSPACIIHAEVSWLAQVYILRARAAVEIRSRRGRRLR